MEARGLYIVYATIREDAGDFSKLVAASAQLWKLLGAAASSGQSKSSPPITVTSYSTASPEEA
jgi:hypothetical protein